MKCTRYPISLFVVLLLLVHTAEAQLLSPRDFLFATPYSDLDHLLLGTNPLGLTPTFRLMLSDQNQFAVGGVFSETVRSLTNGKHTGDFSGGEHFLFLSAGQLHDKIEIFVKRGQQVGKLVSAEKMTDADFRDSTLAVRYTRRFGASGEIWLGGERNSTSIPFRSEALSNLLPLFPQVPRSQWRIRRTETCLGIRHEFRGAIAEVATGLRMISGNIDLSNDDSALYLPTTASGKAVGVSFAVPIRSGAFLDFWKSKGFSTGEHDVFRESGRNIGSSLLQLQEDNFGFAWRRIYADHTRLVFMGEWMNLETRLEALGLLAQPLGFNASNFNVVGAFVDARIHRHILGVDWKHPLTLKSNIDLGYRYLDAPISITTGYSARLFLITAFQESEWNPSPHKGHALRLRYSRQITGFPTTTVTPMYANFELTQFIPAVPLHLRHNKSIGNAGSSETGTTRETRGGWSFGFSVSYFLPTLR